MATFDYSKPLATAHRLLTRFGAAGTLTRRTMGAYDPASGTGTTTTASEAVTAVVLDFPQRYIDGTLIRQGDKRAYVSAVDLEPPQQGDVMTWQGTAYEVVSIKDTAPAGTSLIYELQIRTT
jgi:hypothetical protein